MLTGKVSELKIAEFANSLDPKEVVHNEPPHLVLHCHNEPPHLVLHCHNEPPHLVLHCFRVQASYLKLGVVLIRFLGFREKF